MCSYWPADKSLVGKTSLPQWSIVNGQSSSFMHRKCSINAELFSSYSVILGWSTIQCEPSTSHRKQKYVFRNYYHVPSEAHRVLLTDALSL